LLLGSGLPFEDAASLPVTSIVPQSPTKSIKTLCSRSAAY